jgi:3-oxoacyl-[acyl-carrier protein] reductase
VRLNGRVAIVTGGGRGIGREYCVRLAQEGASVAVADIADEDARAVADQIRAGGGEATPFHVDVADQASVNAAVQAVAERYGGIDILVNNAAIFAPLTRGPWNSFSPDEWDRVMAVNVKGPWLMCLAVVPHMEARGKGKIVNIGSTSIHVADSRLIHYVASKGAILSLTRVLAKELGPLNICVNCLEPGQVQSGTNEANTPMDYVQSMIARRAIKRVEEPTDLGGPLVFLVSDDADFITGQGLIVDGGVVFAG